MKRIKTLGTIAILAFCVSCGSSEKVVTKDGKIYEVKGDKIINNGEDVTNTITNDKSKTISALLKQNDEIEREAELRQKELENAIQEQKNIQDQAKEQQKLLEEQLDKLSDRLNARKEAKAEYIKLKEELQKEQNDFNAKKKEGKLSPNDISKLERKLLELEAEVERAKVKYNKLRALNI